MDLYGTLKKKIIERFTDSDHQRLRKLLQEIELGDKKPSQLLREMRHLAGSKMDDELLRSLWLQRLPPNMRAIISVSTESLTKLTELADKIAEVNEAPHVSVVSRNGTQTQAYPTGQNPSTAIEQQIAELSRAVTQLRASISGSRRARSRSRPRSSSRSFSDRSKSAAPGGEEQEECWYHRTYGLDAKKCRAPCKHKPSN